MALMNISPHRCDAEPRPDIAVGDLVALGAHMGDQFLQVLGWKVRARHQDHRHIGDEADRRKVADRIERQLGIERGRGRLADMHQQQRVAVGRGLGDAIGAEGAAGADDVFDDDRLLQRRTHRCSEQAGDDVARAAGRERNDQRDRPARKFLARTPAVPATATASEERVLQTSWQSSYLPPWLFEIGLIERTLVIRPRSPFRSMRMTARSC